MSEAETEEGVKITLIERRAESCNPSLFLMRSTDLARRYASQEALDRHSSSENYKKFFETVMAEQMLVGAPLVGPGKHVAGFRR